MNSNKTHCRASTEDTVANSSKETALASYDDFKIQNLCKGPKTVLFEKLFLLDNCSEEISQTTTHRTVDHDTRPYSKCGRNVTKLLPKQNCKKNEAVKCMPEPSEMEKGEKRQQENATPQNTKKARYIIPPSDNDPEVFLMPVSISKVPDLMDLSVSNGCAMESVQNIVKNMVRKGIEHRKGEKMQGRTTLEALKNDMISQIKTLKFAEDLYENLKTNLELLCKEYDLLTYYEHQITPNQEPQHEPYQAYNSILCTLVSVIDSTLGIKDRDIFLTRLFLEMPLITEDAIEALKMISFQKFRGPTPLKLLKDLAIKRPSKKLQSLVLNVISCHVSHKEINVQIDARNMLNDPRIAQLFIMHSIINLYNGQSTFSMRGFIMSVLVCTRKETIPKTKLCKEIAQCIDQYLVTVFSQATNVSSEKLVHFYVSKFKSFQINSSLLNEACRWLNGSFPKVYNNRLYDINSLYQYAMVSWNCNVFRHFNEQIISAFLKFVEQERNGETIDVVLMSSVVNSYIEIGKVKEINQPADEIIYRNFESRFFKETVKFYIMESSILLCYCTITEYMNKVEYWLLEEQKHAQIYFDQTTCEKLASICKKALIKKHLHSLYRGFEQLLDIDKKADLAKMYTLVSTVNNGLDGMRDIFENHVANQGLAAIDKYKNSTSIDLKSYVDVIFNIYKKYKELIQFSFQNDVNFETSLDKACRRFINNNAVTKTASDTARSAELLAKCCDLLLKKSCKYSERVEFENILSQVIVLYKYIEDKDVFQELYIKMLAKRLLFRTSISYDAEASMISKLKQACGSGYTSKLQTMLQDISVSKDLNDAFKKDLDKSVESVDLDFSVQVLSSGSWPLQQFSALVLPRELEQFTASFKTFYTSQNSGRKLCWLHQLARGEIVTNCFKRKYTLQASSVQIAVLLQYNLATSWTLQQLHESTQIDVEVLRQVVEVLLKNNLLVTKNSELGPSTFLHLFLGYQNKKHRVNINAPIETEARIEQETINKHIEKKRNIVIQAAIVRIMKKKRKLKHEQLVVDILSELSSKFQPEIPVIQNCIYILINKEYLKRNDKQKNIYDYVA